VSYSGFGFGAWGFLPGSTAAAVTPYAALQVAVITDPAEQVRVLVPHQAGRLPPAPAPQQVSRTPSTALAAL
jgi:hypothetical protein